MRRTLMTALVLVLAVVGAPSGAHATATARRASNPAPAVAGTTILKGDAGAAINVRVPRDAVLDLTPTERANGTLWPKALKASGGDGYAGFLLTERATNGGLYVVAARLPRALRDGTARHGAVGNGQPAVADRDGMPTLMSPVSDPPLPTCVRCRVPAGNYRLQLITFGRPTTVSVTFEGLKGRTTLRPSAPRFLFGMSSSFKAVNPSTHLFDGGGTGMMLGWSWREPGVMLTTHEVDVMPRETPAAVSEARACRGLDGGEHCDGMRLGAGMAPSQSGSSAVGGNRVGSASMSLSFSLVGDTRWVARTSLLWIPTGRTPFTSVAVDAAVEASEGAEAFGTRIWR